MLYAYVEKFVRLLGVNHVRSAPSTQDNTRTTDKVGENDTSPKQNSPDKKPIARRNNLVQPLEQPREQVGITCGRSSWRVPMLLSLSFSRLRCVTFFSMASHPELNQT